MAIFSNSKALESAIEVVKSSLSAKKDIYLNDISAKEVAAFLEVVYRKISELALESKLLD